MDMLLVLALFTVEKHLTFGTDDAKFVIIYWQLFVDWSFID